MQATDVNTITLTWSIKTSAGYPIQKFQVERTKLPGQIVEVFDVPTSPSPVSPLSFDDTGLAPCRRGLAIGACPDSYPSCLQTILRLIARQLLLRSAELSRSLHNLVRQN